MAGDRRAAGMLQMTEEWGEAPPHWMLYFSVIDCDSSAARVKELGGEVCVPPTEIPPAGRFSVLSDPQGAYFSIIRPTPEEEREMKQ
jgi:predicted enzyme related to lactoylglutathione lyase